MAGGVQATITGFEKIAKSCEEYLKEVKRRKMIGMRLVGLAFKADVQERAPYKRGDYRRSIHAENPVDEGDTVVVRVGTNRIDAKQHEFGGIIRAKNKPYLVFKTEDGQWHSVKSVYQKPRPHFQPALEQNFEKYQRILAGALAQ